MFTLEKSRKRVLVYMLFVVAFVRMVLARILPPQAITASRRQDRNARFHHGVMLRFGASPRQQLASSHDLQQYAITATGTFPFVRLVTVSTKPVPVAFELASLGALSSSPSDSKVGTGLHHAKRSTNRVRNSRPNHGAENSHQHALVHKVKSSGDDPFCVVACDSCSSCGGCGSCGSCTPTSCTPTSCCPTSCGPNSCGPNSCCTTTTTTTSSCGSSSCCP